MKDLFVSYLARRLPLVEQALVDTVDTPLTESRVAPDLERYLYLPLARFTSSGGKRVRPVLALLGALSDSAHHRVHSGLGVSLFQVGEEDRTLGGGTVEKMVFTRDLEAGMFVNKGKHERQFACEAHTASDKYGFVLGAKVTVGNIYDGIAWDDLYDQVTSCFKKIPYHPLQVQVISI